MQLHPPSPTTAPPGARGAGEPHPETGGCVQTSPPTIPPTTCSLRTWRPDHPAPPQHSCRPGPQAAGRLPGPAAGLPRGKPLHSDQQPPGTLINGQQGPAHLITHTAAMSPRRSGRAGHKSGRHPGRRGAGHAYSSPGCASSTISLRESPALAPQEEISPAVHFSFQITHGATAPTTCELFDILERRVNNIKNQQNLGDL